MLKDIYDSIDDHYAETVDIRRYLHQYPEVSFEEFKTAQYIADFYKKLDIPYEMNIGGNGVIATLQGALPGKTVALRADFDALPIQDEKSVPYKSTNPGVMHACGHDGHTASLLTLAKVMKEFQNELIGTIVFVHQHAEEFAPGGAKPIIETGKLDHVDAVFGNHLWATTPVGRVETRTGPLMAGADRIELIVQGKGGHGAFPHEAKDAIVIGAEIVTKLQSIVSRKVDPLKPAVITIGRFDAGTTFNVIADKATIIGTVRYFDKEVQQLIMTEIENVVKGISIANDVICKLDYITGYPPVINHEAETDILFAAREKIKEVDTSNETPFSPQMGGEDFAYYLQHKPGAFFFTGAKIEGQNYPHHHPMFDIDERSLPIAAKMLIGAYMLYQEKNK